MNASRMVKKYRLKYIFSKFMFELLLFLHVKASIAQFYAFLLFILAKKSVSSGTGKENSYSNFRLHDCSFICIYYPSAL